MKTFLIAFCIVIGSVLGTVSILAACGDTWTPPYPSESNVSYYGTQCDGEFGKRHTWQIYWNDHNAEFTVSQPPASCIHTVCYPGFDTPVWVDSNKNVWNEVTHYPAEYQTQYGFWHCSYDGANTRNNRTQHYCNAEEAEDEETCEANTGTG